MNILSNLKPAKGGAVKKNSRRRGRGQGSGGGGTARRGHKGQKSRSGYSRKRNFEGGQTPYQMRVPKRGFKNPNRVEYVALNLDQVQEFCDKHNIAQLDFETLRKLRGVKKSQKFKILGRGELKRPINISLHACSASAKEAIEAAGGTITII